MKSYSNLKTHKWFIEKKTQADEYRVFVFHHAGGGASYYMPMLKYFSENVSVYLVQLPGREYRINDRPYNFLNPLLDDLIEAMKPYLDKPFVFLGHSMGAMIAFELVHKLRDTYGLTPKHLFLSSKCAPHMEKKYKYQNLSDNQLVLKLFDFGGMDIELAKENKLMKMILPILRKDIQLCDDYQCCRSEVLDVPVTILGGNEDQDVNLSDLVEWDKYFNNEFNVCIFKGNHFYFKDDYSLLVSTIMKMQNTF